MSIESGGDLKLGLGSIRQNGIKLRAATLADSKEIRRCLHDAELALCHDSSLLPSREPVDFRRHHYLANHLGSLTSTACDTSVCCRRKPSPLATMPSGVCWASPNRVQYARYAGPRGFISPSVSTSPLTGGEIP